MKKFLFMLVLLLIVPMFLPVSSGISPDIRNISNSQIAEEKPILPEYSLPENHKENIIEENKIVEPKITESKITESETIESKTIESLVQEYEIEKPLPKRNKETDNLNILFIGADKDKLLMTAIYSIDYKDKEKNLKSGSVFFPKSTVVKYNGQSYTLQGLYNRYPDKDYGYILVEILEELLEVEIAYHVHMDKAVLQEANKILDPIIVNEERINIEDIFEIPATNQDHEVLGQLMKQLTRPTTYFYKLPALVIKSSRHMDTDFPLTPENLLLHFRIAREVKMEAIQKVILDQDCPQDILKDIIYTITN